MLIRREIVETNPDQTIITVDRPARRGGLLPFAIILTMFVVGFGAYLSGYFSQPAPQATTVIVPDNSRAERLANPNPKPVPNPTTIVVNPPPVIQVAPPAPTPRPDGTTYIVPGSSSESTPPIRSTGTGEDDSSSSKVSGSHDSNEADPAVGGSAPNGSGN